MIKNVGLIILLMVAMGLAVIYFVIDKDVDPIKTGKLFSLTNSDSIDEIKITNSYGFFLFVKKDDIWVLKEPGEYNVNQTKSSLLEKSLLNLKVNRELDFELEEYGLATPSIIVDFYTKKNIHKTLHVGSLTPSKSQIYLKDAETGKIYVADIGTIVQFDGSLIAYRGKEVFSINSDLITELSYMKNGINQFTIQKIGPKEWQFIYPFSAPARFIEMSEMVVKMRKWTAAGYPDPLIKNYDDWGLIDPLNAIIIKDTSGKSQKIEFGNTEGGMIYARTGSEDDIVKLFNVDVDFSILSIDQLLYVAPLQTTIENVSQIEIQTMEHVSIVDLDHTKSPVSISISGKEIPYEVFISFFVKYIGLSANGYDSQTLPGTSFLKLNTVYIDGAKESIDLLYRNDESYFIESTDFQGFYINKDEIEPLLNRWDAVLVTSQ